jgi:hypothetical protein
MLATIALGVPVAFSCGTALFKLLTSEQYAGASLAAAVVLPLAAGVLLLAAVALLLLPLPHPARNAAAVRARTSIAARRRASALKLDGRSGIFAKIVPTGAGPHHPKRMIWPPRTRRIQPIVRRSRR